ncbi:hypothetical protein HK099_000785 [Clydaea vesicula]|uniref:Uncharacterized protein n=1 Tax=Clydaea vesicula TaxID=447962 RepID=A0AAD5UBG6_9FUNG|nr:hypothetical protein HK099_000785 [Clydaea vesicula]KAJ3393952.1 hypothetical protein HDU92_007330 [Lobulomyces angularis]
MEINLILVLIAIILVAVSCLVALTIYLVRSNKRLTDNFKKLEEQTQVKYSGEDQRISVAKPRKSSISGRLSFKEISLHDIDENSALEKEILHPKVVQSEANEQDDLLTEGPNYEISRNNSLFD